MITGIRLLVLRNHVLNVLEQASLEPENSDLRKSLLAFDVVGGGYGGFEPIGELNDVVKETIREFYKNIFFIKYFSAYIEVKRIKKQNFGYKTKGMMADIGKRAGVAELFGFKIHGFIAWGLWRTF